VRIEPSNLAAKRHRPTNDAWLSWPAFAVWASATIAAAAAPDATFATGLPLGWASVTAVVASVAMAAPQWRLPRAVLHVWGGAVVAAAVIGDSVGTLHMSVAFVLACDGCIRGYRLNRDDALVGGSGAIAYACVLLPVNFALGASYGGLGTPRVEAAVGGCLGVVTLCAAATMIARKPTSMREDPRPSLKLVRPATPLVVRRAA
jgi:hypothetical protein